MSLDRVERLGKGPFVIGADARPPSTLTSRPLSRTRSAVPASVLLAVLEKYRLPREGVTAMPRRLPHEIGPDCIRASAAGGIRTDTSADELPHPIASDEQPSRPRA